MTQQNNIVIYVVNLGAEAKRFTHTRCKVLTRRGGGGGGGGRGREMGHLSSKSRPDKISVQMMLPSESISLCEPFITTHIVMSMYHSKVE